jgi:site-specific recombinase XerD
MNTLKPQNENTTEQELADDSRKAAINNVEKLLDGFEASFYRDGKSATTTKNYLKNLRQFFKANGISQIDQITKEGIQNWMTVLRRRNCGTGFIVAHLWGLKAFLKFVQKDKGIACYQWDISIPEVPSAETVEYLELDELEKIFALMDLNNINDLRLRAFIELMLNTGMRPSETLHLKRSDLAGKPQEIEIIGKGNKKRDIYLNERSYYWVDLYLAQRKDDHPALFVTHNGKDKTTALSLRGAEYAFQKLIKKFGTKRRIVLHTLRHSFATLYMAKGCPSDYIARLLGHSSTKTTRKYYLAVNQKHAKEAYFQFNPFGIGSSYELPQKSMNQLAIIN